MKKINPLTKHGFQTFLIIILLGIFTSCSNFHFSSNRLQQLDAGSINYYQKEGMNLILRNGENSWQLLLPVVKDDTLSASLRKLPDTRYDFLDNQKENRKEFRDPDNKFIFNEVHLYTDNLFQNDESVKIPLADIQKAYLFLPVTTPEKVNKSTALLAGGIIAAIVVLVVVTENSKPNYSSGNSSCPFVFSYNDEDLIFSGEMYGGAVSPQLERHDYLYLPDIKPSEGRYKLAMLNLAHEIQNTNLAELIVVEHSEFNRPYIDKYGRVFTVSDEQPAVKALDLKGNNVLHLLSEADGKSYETFPEGAGDALMDELILTFKPPVKGEQGKLILKARNTLYLDYYYSEYLSLFGEKLSGWQDKLARKSAEGLTHWMDEQGIPLSIFVQKNGEWILHEKFEPPGPLTFRDYITAIDIPDSGDTDINIKISAGKLFWELDKAVMDFTDNTVSSIQNIKPHKATDQDSYDITHLISDDDSDYFIQANYGDQAELTYNVPHNSDEVTRSVFLHSKGHYRILPFTNTNSRSLVYMSRFKKQGSFTRYAAERYMEALKQAQNQN